MIKGMKGLFFVLGALMTVHTAYGQDDCASAITVTDLTGTICATTSPSNTNALAAGTCEEGTLDTWFQFTAQGPNADIDISSTQNGFRPEFLVVSGTPASTCAGFVEEGCFDGGNGNYTALSGSITGLTTGETYWIVVSSNGNSTGGTTSACVTNPAVNPACVDNEDCNTPATLTLNAPGAAAACVTDCNTGASAGPDFIGVNCFDLPNSTVWYEITTSATTTTIDVNLTSGDLSDPEFTVFSTADCITFTPEDCIEGTAGSASITSLNVSANTTYLIAVSDATADEGDFTLCVTQNDTPTSTCVDNEECPNAEVLTLNPSGGAALCTNDCNTGATAGLDFVGPPDCAEMPGPTVWYQITTDALVATLDIDLSSASDLSDPEWALFTDNGCISPWTTVACSEGTAGSSVLTDIPVNANTTYLLAVSDASGDEGNFTLCITQNPDNSACNTDNTLAVTATSLGSPAGGPYLPGEVVTFCYTINTYESVNCNYLQGIVPTFGDCWDPVSFDGSGMPTVTTALVTQGTQSYFGPPFPACEGDPAGNWAWYPAGTVDYNLSSPNSLGYTAGDDVGAGWFFTTNYDSFDIENAGLLDCTNDNLNPNDNYGDNSFTGCPTLGGWQVCFQLQAKPITACAAGETDCTVSVKTFGDGEIGVWSNVGCTVDGLTSEPGTINCLLPAELASFTGQFINGETVIEWETITETNTDYFIVNHWLPGGEMQEVGRVEAAENSQSLINYQLIHLDPSNGLNYYSLTGVDLDGTKKSHGSIAVNASVLSAYYDQVNQHIVLSSPASVEIYSLDGKLVKSSSGTTHISFNQKGVFMIHDVNTGSKQRILVH